MANTLAATSRQTRELLGYVASRATRSPSNHAPPTNPLLNRLEIHHGYPVFWEGNIGSAPEHRSFPNGNNPRGSCCVST